MNNQYPHIPNTTNPGINYQNQLANSQINYNNPPYYQMRNVQNVRN